MAKEWNREAFHKRMEEDKQMFAQWRKEDARTEFRQRSEAARMMRTGMIAFLFVITFSVIIIFISLRQKHRYVGNSTVWNITSKSFEL